MVKASTTPVANLLKKALAHQNAGRLQQALPLYQQILKLNPKHPEATQQLGIINVNQGRLEQALPLLRTALEAKPTEGERWLRYADALMRAGKAKNALSIIAQARQHNLKGELVDKVEAQAQRMANLGQLDLAGLDNLLNNGHFAQAEQQAQAQLAEHPNHPRLKHYLGLALYQQDRFEDALPHFQAAAEQLPQDANVQNQLALSLKHLKRHEEALEAYKKVVALLPDTPSVYANIGANLNDAREFDQALEWVNKGLAIDPNDQPCRANKAIALFEKDQVLEAEALAKGLLEEGYRNEITLVTWARVRLKEGDPDVALACFEEAEQLGGKDAATCLFKGNALNDLGRFDDAMASFEESLALDPEMASAWASIAQARKMTTDDQDWWEGAKAFLEKEDLEPQQAFNLHYAMGKFCNDIKDYDNAFPHYQKANQLKHDTWTESRYDRARQEKLVEVMLDRYVPGMFAQWQDVADPSMRPLFIVGMPRSGTSLTEQILASHPEIHGAGELNFWPRLANDNERVVLNSKFDAEWLQKAAQQCLDYLKEKSPDAARVVDKMPGNFIWVGLIHTVFPNARILHTMRNPVDNGISIFFQNFNKGHAYANDLEDIAHHYRQYHRLMQHWRQVIPEDNFLDLPYEQLVEDQEGWSKRIMEFVGLDFDERMLEFYKTERKVGTASNWQARQPIYKTSKERWRHYEKFVGPLLPLLELYDPERGQIVPE
ncbi:sulfotransferase [Halomonas sp. CUBES01]|uniref:sulfotransferase n=1 Tax=Halomonas sp. CUBES01 TaxID=2897340 RepID=UPI001E46A8A0|nr:tetratricopeptide repeat-containing sulfotransferase family protein [Halomonas sp. CUBES01]MEC4766707.1 sulfotransferase [Halomonas sp. CUBES01]